MNSMEEMPKPSWKDLPTELFVCIIRLLDDAIDILRFRSICSSWRCFTSLKDAFLLSPIKIPCTISSNDRNNKGHFFFHQSSTVYLLQSVGIQQSQSFFIKVKKGDRFGKFNLLFPLTPHREITDPPMSLNMLDYRVTRVARFYRLSFVKETEAVEAVPSHFEEPMTSSITSIICMEMLAFAEKVEGEPSFSVQILKVVYDKHVIFGLSMDNRLLFRRLGEENWIVICGDESHLQAPEYGDIAIHKGKYYAVISTGEVTIFGSDFKVIGHVAAPNIPDHLSVYSQYLVESVGDLFFVVRVLEQVSEGAMAIFEVYKLDEENLDWDKVNRLEGRTIFVSDVIHDNFCVLATNLPDFKENCIYYDGEEFWHSEEKGFINSRVLGF